MGETLIAGLLRAGAAPTDVVAADVRPQRCAELEQRYGISTASNAEAVRGAQVVLVVVKPQDVPTVLPGIAANLDPDALIVSLCAGVPTSQIEALLPDGAKVVRVMPNTPAQVSAGMAAVSGGAHASAADVQQVLEMMRSVGEAVEVAEKYQDAVTALSGSGPAYVFYMVEALIDAGVQLGLPRDTAAALVGQTVYGSARLLLDSGEHPTVLRERVTSPAGTTAAGLRVLDERGVKAAFMAAAEAARDRSVELGS